MQPVHACQVAAVQGELFVYPGAFLKSYVMKTNASCVIPARFNILYQIMLIGITQLCLHKVTKLFC